MLMIRVFDWQHLAATYPLYSYENSKDLLAFWLKFFKTDIDSAIFHVVLFI